MDREFWLVLGLALVMAILGLLVVMPFPVFVLGIETWGVSFPVKWTVQK